MLRVLRGNMAQLLTILEVVIHDPLYKWSLSPVQANARRQRQLEAQTNQAAANNDAQSFFPLGDDKAALREEKSERASSSSQDAAQRALLRVQNKLKGCVYKLQYYMTQMYFSFTKYAFYCPPHGYTYYN